MGERDDADVPEPPPFTTIAWRLVHIDLTFVTFSDRLFVHRVTTGAETDIVPSSQAAVALIERDYRRWRERMSELNDEQWWAPLGPAFGPYADDSVVDLAIHVLDEFTHHGAEVGVLRDLYLRRDALTRTTQA